MDEAADSKLPALEIDEPLELEDASEQMNLRRVLDAGANRAGEALRVIEDYSRFCLDDSFLTRQLKEMRHALAVAIRDIVGDFLPSRHTLSDVGTSIFTSHEQVRESVIAVVQANFKRLQEALRSLEEFGKVGSAELGKRLESLRYQSYTLEQTILLGAGARQRLKHARLYVLITASHCAGDIEWTIEEAAAAGARIFQLREKKLNDRELLERAKRVRRATHKAGVLFIVNDRPDIARLAQADGVHLGQHDLPIRQARRILGSEPLVGISTHTLEQVRAAVLEGASYIGVGPTFPSGSKEFADYPGRDFIRAAARETSLPQFAIGGINLETIGGAVEAGATRVAVSAALCTADDPRQVAAEMIRTLEQLRENQPQTNADKDA